ncbi:AMP binding enzyme [Ceratobasidium sp. AG-Ba]|nr:AMP binding enzyme [Ceratobasidium sp. AG-Ba]
MGLNLYNFRLFLSPVTLVVLPFWNPEVALRCISKYRVTNLSLVPSLVFQLLAHPELKSDKTDLSSLVSIGAGAAYLPPDTEREFIDAVEAKGVKGAKVKLSNGYGLSEAGSLLNLLTACSMASYDESLALLECSYRARLEIRLCYDAPAGTPMEKLVDVPLGEPGELYVRGLNNALGYWKNEKSTKETFLPGNWMRTGDRFIYKKGHLWFQDRAKDTLKVSGVQVSPTEIEDALKSIPARMYWKHV